MALRRLARMALASSVPSVLRSTVAAAGTTTAGRAGRRPLPQIPDDGRRSPLPTRHRRSPACRAVGVPTVRALPRHRGSRRPIGRHPRSSRYPTGRHPSRLRSDLPNHHRRPFRLRRNPNGSDSGCGCGSDSGCHPRSPTRSLPSPRPPEGVDRPRWPHHSRRGSRRRSNLPTIRPGRPSRSVRKHPWSEQCTAAQDPVRTMTDRYRVSYHSARRSMDQWPAHAAPCSSPALRSGPPPPSPGSPRALDQPVGQGHWVAGRHQHGVTAGRLPVAVDVAGHHHGPGRHGLEQDHPEGLAPSEGAQTTSAADQPAHLLLLGQDPQPLEVGCLGVAPAEAGRLGPVSGHPQDRRATGRPGRFGDPEA